MCSTDSAWSTGYTHKIQKHKLRPSRKSQKLIQIDYMITSKSQNNRTFGKKIGENLWVKQKSLRFYIGIIVCKRK